MGTYPNLALDSQSGSPRHGGKAEGRSPKQGISPSLPPRTCHPQSQANHPAMHTLWPAKEWWGKENTPLPHPSSSQGGSEGGKGPPHLALDPQLA